MGVLEAIIYGIIQGIAEFLPISSSGHLALAQNFFGTETENGFTFNIALHLATLVSVCVVYRADILMLIKGCFSLIKKLFTGKLKQGLDKGERLFLMLVIATLPLVPVKLLGLDDAVEALSGISWAIGALLIFNGIMLFVSDRLPKKDFTTENGGFLRPLGVGVVQALLGVMPGISRSGSTITGGRIFGFSREEAVRFSFLMSIPAILGALVLDIKDMFTMASDTLSPLPVAVGMITAAVSGYFAIKFLLRLVEKSKLSYFSIYCVVAGIFAIILNFTI